ncbi:acyl-CoA N-acyltransferase [Rhizopus microsporus var. microsporus]|uniref:Glucosamine 6-phosphate N-acetyltransferase n=2 Tax=Rhizopus microsporus TaxID=58291 RepID=A0A2G4SQV5_RHIZD|nr:acyl-CoA N-acyltransferase [Rhizopus microsporus ATCC 52813]ORE08480.1 acyl-CoA N-acyltransferase [Rhizopus microsporus var. microsporus]PHZ11140.1 acyl-CoA N-acyltransferase [Rhizopus microsporus ATCC 52813]
MPTYNNIRILHATTPKDFEKCLEVRQEVFINEQKHSVAIERDGLDDICQHWVAVCDKVNEDGTIDADYPIGNVRLMPKPDGVAKLGRLGVLSSARGLYVGQMLVKAFIEYCKKNEYTTIVLHAQNDKRGFYERAGFKVEEGDDEIFMESHTPHVRMWMRNL